MSRGHKQIHAIMIRTGTGLITNTIHVQHSNPHFHNVYTWNTIIKNYYKSKHPKSSLLLFREMAREHIQMNKHTYIFALKACERFSQGASHAEVLHCRTYKLGFDSELVIRNVLMHVYGKHGCVISARKMFDESPVRDVFSWTTVIDCFKSIPSEAMKQFCMMLRNGVEPNEVTMIPVLSSCGVMRSLRLGRLVHGYIEKSHVVYSVNLLNTLMDMYVKCGSLSTGREVFDRMDVRDVYSSTIMIDGYAKEGELEVAREFFDELCEKNVVCWNAMIAGYSQKDKPKEALELFRQMEEMGFRPVEGTLVCVFSSCGQLGCLDRGKNIYHYYVDQRKVGPSVKLGNAFIDMCAKCGSVDVANEFFNRMPERDLVSWNSMIVGYAVHGYAEQALDHFRQMQNVGLKPDDITFVGLLSACCHGGLVIQGRDYLENMKKVFGIEPKSKHYACLIDLLGRVGLIGEAIELIKRMPMEPDEAAWGALLSACRMHGNIDLGKFVSDRLLELDSGDSGTYALLASMYASKRKWDGVRMVRSMMRTRGVKKTPGVSSIEVDGKSHEFLVDDKSHSQSEEIYQLLDDIFILLKLEGYIPTPS